MTYERTYTVTAYDTNGKELTQAEFTAQCKVLLDRKYKPMDKPKTA